MKSIHIEIPEKMADELHQLVAAGWFQSEEEGIRLAIMDYLRRNKTEIHERFLREDINWALEQSKAQKT